jgi:hypothetical protein
MNDAQLMNFGKRKLLWQEIKQMEREFGRNQDAINNLQKAQFDLGKQLGEKLGEIQNLAEIADAEFIKNEIENDR